MVTTETIAITSEDQSRLVASYLWASWPMWGILMLISICGPLAVMAFDLKGTVAVGCALGLPAVAATVCILLVIAARSSLRAAYPLGSLHSLAVTASSIELVGPAGSSVIRCWRLAGRKKTAGAVFVVVLPTRVQLVLPARLVSAAAFAAMRDRSSAVRDE